MGKLNAFKLLVKKWRLKKQAFQSDENERRFVGERFDDEEDDLPLTINREEGPGVTYYSTENSEFSKGKKKVNAHGIDSFGEQDTFSIEEADDYQTNRDRHQNSDLSKRFYTGGLDT